MPDAPLEASRAVVIAIEATGADFDVFASFCRQHVERSKCAKLRMVYPGLDGPVFGFTGEFLKFNFEGQ